MSVTKARQELHRHGKTGNWRFKGLMLAAMSGSDITPGDMAKAWPKPGQKSDYRFLSRHQTRDPEMEMDARIVGEEGSSTHRMLRDHKSVDVGGDVKFLSNTEPVELGDGSLGSHKDGFIKRMLFAGTSREEVDTLFRNELLDVVMEGAQARQIARNHANVMSVNTPRGDVPVAEDDEFARRVGEGSAIRDDRENYTTVPYDTVKFGQGARITDEMIDTANIPAIERQIQRVGRSVENAINREWLTTVVDDADDDNTVTIDDSADDPGYDALNRAYGAVDEQDFRPDTFITHPQYRTELYSDNALRFANRAGSDEVVRDRVFDPLLDMEHAAASGRTYDSANGEEVFGFTDENDVGAVAYDSENVHVILYAPNGNDIEIKDYEDPIRDLNGMNARIHTTTIYTQQRSAAKIEQSA